MQRYKTGLGGYKTFNQTMLLNRMAPWLDRDKGGSKLALTDADLLRECHKPERSKKNFDAVPPGRTVLGELIAMTVSSHLSP
jgi:hypothetical protein